MKCLGGILVWYVAAVNSFVNGPIRQFHGYRSRKEGLGIVQDWSKVMTLPQETTALLVKEHEKNGYGTPRITSKDRVHPDRRVKDRNFFYFLSAGTKQPHDEIIFRNRRGELLSIPQAERYSSRDWLHNMMTWPTSYVLKRIRGPVMWNMVWALLVATFHIVSQRRILRTMATKPHGLIGSALGLLLVFRTNAAYNRFWEGRCLWEKILNTSRDIGRYCLTYTTEIGMKRISRITNLVIAYSVVLQEHLQGIRHTKETEGLLDPEDSEDLARAKNRPLHILSMITTEIRQIETQPSFGPRERLAFLNMINSLSSYMGGCERLVQTPVPLTYARHTSRFLTLWCLTLPLFLVPEYGLLTVPIVGLLTWSLFGIQEIGLIIEDPFRKMLKLDVICNTIYSDMYQTLSGSGTLPIHANPFFTESFSV